jgi:hypothetical protein
LENRVKENSSCRLKSGERRDGRGETENDGLRAWLEVNQKFAGRWHLEGAR